MNKCDMCGSEHKDLFRIGQLYLKGSEDDHICNRCRLELSKFARTIRLIADKVRFEEIAIYKAKEK